MHAAEGDFSLRTVPALDPAAIARLRAFVKSDPAARAAAEALRAEADPRLDLPAEALAVIDYEGLVNTDPRRLATVAKLRRMDDVAVVHLWWQASGDPAAAAAVRRHLLAWANTYAPTGNDVNENKLTPLLVAYPEIRDTFTPDERARVEAWLERLGAAHLAGVRESHSFDNRYVKRLRILASCARALGRPDWSAEIAAGIRRYLAGALRADGTSTDLEERDSLGYHVNALRPLVELCAALGPEGVVLYHERNAAGGSIARSVAYVEPYADGTRTREEWRHTKVTLDRERAAAGIPEYQPGVLFDPRAALPLFEEAAFFEPRYRRLVLRLAGKGDAAHPSWRSVVQAALAAPAPPPR